MSDPRPEASAAGERPLAPVESVDTLLERLRRERADFRGYKQRVERERAEDRERAQAEVIEALLPLLDDLDRALAHVPDDLAGHPWSQGVELSRRRLLEVVRGWSVQRVGVVGERFNPAVHEAVAYEDRPGASELTISGVERPGYRLGSRLVRAARVSVAGPPRSPGPTIPTGRDT